MPPRADRGQSPNSSGQPAIALGEDRLRGRGVTRNAFLVDDDYYDALSMGPANLFPSTAPVPSLDGSRPQAHPRVSPHWPTLIGRLRIIDSHESGYTALLLLSSPIVVVLIFSKLSSPGASGRAGPRGISKTGFAVAVFLRTIYDWLPAISRALQERRDQYSEKMRENKKRTLAFMIAARHQF
jgi:hypothetical protein